MTRPVTHSVRREVRAATGVVTGAGASTRSPFTRSWSRCRRPRAPYTRSGRTAMTAPTVSAVMTASPMPISTCTPTIAVATLPMETSVVPPTAYSSVKAIAAAGTETSAATKEATVTERRLRGSTASRPRKTAYETTVVTIAMSVMFTPSAVSPPSANSTPCMSSTTDTHSTAV